MLPCPSINARARIMNRLPKLHKCWHDNALVFNLEAMFLLAHMLIFSWQRLYLAELNITMQYIETDNIS